jgi:hypothetical protein
MTVLVTVLAMMLATVLMTTVAAWFAPSPSH